MMTQEELEYLGIEVKGAAAMVRGFQELFDGITSESCLDEDIEDELYSKALELFAETIEKTFSRQILLLWSDLDGATVHVINLEDEATEWKQEAERIFEDYPVLDSGDPDYDEFLRRSRFACEISFSQFAEFAGNDLYNMNCFCVDETGLTFNFPDNAAIIKAHENGDI